MGKKKNKVKTEVIFLGESNDLLTQGIEVSFEIPALNPTAKMGLRMSFFSLFLLGFLC